jgi:hypothetical protein
MWAGLPPMSSRVGFSMAGAESGARGERASARGRLLLLPFFKTQHYLSRPNPLALSSQLESDELSTRNAILLLSRGQFPSAGPASASLCGCKQFLDHLADLHELM